MQKIFSIQIPSTCISERIGKPCLVFSPDESIAALETDHCVQQTQDRGTFIRDGEDNTSTLELLYLGYLSYFVYPESLIQLKDLKGDESCDEYSRQSFHDYTVNTVSIQVSCMKINIRLAWNAATNSKPDQAQLLFSINWQSTQQEQEDARRPRRGPDSGPLKFTQKIDLACSEQA